MFSTRALRIVPAQEEGVGPGAGRQVEPDQRALDQDRGEPVVRRAPQEPGVDADRVHIGLAYAEHPEVGPTAPDPTGAPDRKASGTRPAWRKKSRGRRPSPFGTCRAVTKDTDSRRGFGAGDG